MKTRLGFVSNSSSSSFIIGYKGSDKDLNLELKQALKFPDGYPIKPNSDFSYILEHNIYERFSSLDDYLKWCNEESNDSDKFIVYLLKDDYKVALGSVCDEDEYAEAFLCESDIHYKSDRLVIEKDGGY